METGILILAAGSSSRMGQSKQLLKINDRYLLEKIASEALKVSNLVFVVLGSQMEEHLMVIGQLPVQIVENKLWKKGMGSSLKAGFATMLSHAPLLERAMILVCDKPLLNAAHMEKMIQTSDATGKPIVASSFAGTSGVPVLFKRPVFEKLLLLNDEEGAKSLLRELADSVATVAFPGGEIDLDTPGDYSTFTK